MKLIEQIKLGNKERLELFSDMCVRPGVPEYEALIWKYYDSEDAKGVTIDSTMVMSLLAAKGFKKFSKSWLNIL